MNRKIYCLLSSVIFAWCANADTWTDITAKTSEERAAYNFFKVTVEMK